MKTRNSRNDEVRSAISFEERASYPELPGAFSDNADDNPHGAPNYMDDCPANDLKNDMEVIR